MHEGHRNRLTNKIKTSGGLYEHELLEVLLFNAVPRKDLNATAHELIARFKRIDGVMKASVEELTKVDGVGRNMAEYIVCLGKSLKRMSSALSFTTVSNTSQFTHFLSVRFESFECDALEIYCLDKDGRIRRVCPFYGKGADKAQACYEEILKIISVYKPYSVYAAYYRTGDSVFPESSDDKFVASLSKACAINGVRLYDYCITCRDSEETFSYFVTDRLASAFAYDANYGGKA